MTDDAQERLRADIAKIQDETTIEKVQIFIMGILAQQGIEQAARQRGEVPFHP